MIKTKDVDVTVYELTIADKRTVKVQAMFALDGIILDRDENGSIKLESKVAVQKALKEALSKWEFSDV